MKSVVTCSTYSKLKHWGACVTKYALRSHHSYSVSRISSLFQPAATGPTSACVDNSAQLLTQNGYVQQCSPGLFALLPLAQRVLTKLLAIVDEEMTGVGAQKLLLPTLTSTHLWHNTGRLEEAGPELMNITDRHGQKYVLSPTHEEAVCDLLSRYGCNFGYSRLPLRLYQVSSKFRDEVRPRHALSRSREFLMKDLYSFDVDETAATAAYEDVTRAYHKIFSRIGVPYCRAGSSCGAIGGLFSHEFHLLSNAGQDYVLQCDGCGCSVTAPLLEERGVDVEVGQAPCPDCGKTMTGTKAIEVGHTFLLGTKYSAPLQAVFRDRTSSPQPLVMGCYGLGITRILQATLEVTSIAQHTEDRIVWPWALAPYRVCIIGPKRGSKEISALPWQEALASAIIQRLPAMHDDIILDDRDSLTIGKRVAEARRTGYPLIIVAGKRALEDVPKFECIDNTLIARQLCGADQLSLLPRTKSDAKGGAFLTQLELLNALEEIWGILPR